MRHVCLLLVFIALATIPVSGQVQEAFDLLREATPVETACEHNQRVILGAIEMYNMDHQEMIKTLDDSMVRAGGVLVKESYLKTPIESPAKDCVYASNGDLSVSGRVTCRVHATPVVSDQKTLLSEFKRAVVRMLEAGQDINATNQAGETLLHRAVKAGNRDIVEYLLARGSNTSLKDREGKTPWQIAIELKKGDLVTLLSSGDAALASILGTGMNPGLKIQGTLLAKKGETGEYAAAPSMITLESGVWLKNEEQQYASIEVLRNSDLPDEKPPVRVVMHHASEVYVSRAKAGAEAQDGPTILFRCGDGEWTVMRGSSIAEGNVVFQVGSISAFLQSGTTKVISRDGGMRGEIVMRNGLSRVTPVGHPEEEKKVSGFYRVTFENGVLNNVVQASIMRYRWPN